MGRLWAGCGVVLSGLLVTRLVWVWGLVCRGFSILGGLSGFLVDFPVWVGNMLLRISGWVDWCCGFPG